MKLTQLGQNIDSFQSFIQKQRMEKDFIEIDGSLYQGGGQMIRSSLALSIILQRQFRIHSIRKNRPKPGINNQLRSVFSAFTQKIPKVGDTEVYFFPSFLEPTHIKSSTAASISLMLQCFVPICVGLKYQKEIKIEGGTDVNKAPCLESLHEALIPNLLKMGVKLQINDIKRGFFPVGKGHYTINVQLDGQYIKPIILKQFQPPTNIIITYYLKEKHPPGSAKEFQKDVKKQMRAVFGQQIKLDLTVKAEKVFNTKNQYGIGCILKGPNVVWDIGTVGQPIKQETILERLEHYCQQQCCVDEHHQDQFLLLAALANGKSQILIGQEMSMHTKSLIYIINSFLPEVKIQHKQGILTIQGIGHKCGRQKKQQ